MDEEAHRTDDCDLPEDGKFLSQTYSDQTGIFSDMFLRLQSLQIAMNRLDS